MDAPELVSCADLARAGLATAACCPTCHHDDAAGYSALGEYALRDGRVACVCCTVRQELAEKGLLDDRMAR